LLRFQHPWLVWLLPAAGAVSAGMYLRFGQNAERGSNLILEEIHEPKDGVPLRMAPLVLLGTLITHLFGGSAGREGTAVQMGGSLASTLNRIPGFRGANSSILLSAGMAAGFAGVFGTPFAGTVFAIEVVTIGRMNLASFVPCLLAAVVSDRTCLILGATHTHYSIASPATGSHFVGSAADVSLLLKCVLVGTVFGLVSQLFVQTTHLVHALCRRIPGPVFLRPVAGGVAVLLLWLMAGSSDYLGLGVLSGPDSTITVSSAFNSNEPSPFAWLWKLIFTATTVGSGFKGGEVTPLFYVGATLGNVLSGPMDAPMGLFAGLGFVAVFAGATNTPLACTIMAVELFGSDYLTAFAITCATAWLFSGSAGLYSAQRVFPKHDG
jgi:H+/Cl- antiporter ClcA